MSKPRRTILFFSLGCLFILFSGLAAAAREEPEVSIKIDAAGSAVVEARYRDARPDGRNLSFSDSYAGLGDLAARVSDLRLIGRDGRVLEYRKLGPGEFLAPGDILSWSCRIDLRPSERLAALAHVSWAGPEEGILMTGDLLPRAAAKAAKVRLELPAGWTAATLEKKSESGVYAVADVEKAVFYVGRNRRESVSETGGARVRLLVSGAWRFSDEEARRMTDAIFAEYEKLFGGRSFAEAIVFLGRFPESAKFGRWEAETRGASVTIFSADMPFPTQSVQKLHEQLRHELFHLWIPNGVNLSGNYDWFYEGFALYQSLRTAVATNRIRFDDYLDTLGRAYDIDALQSGRASLLEASQNRWNGAETQIYARGMLVGFLVDLAILRESKGKSSLTDVWRELYRRYRPPAAREDGNAAVLKILRARREVAPLVEKYVAGTENIGWQTDLAAAGIEAATENFSTKLKVTAKPSGRQKDLLDKLGYNNWRNRSE